MNAINNFKDLDKENWKFIEISKVTDKIIKKLVYNLKTNLSEDFFISFESLLFIIGKKPKLDKIAESVIESSISEMDGTRLFNKKILEFILNAIKNKQIQDILVAQLYRPDFVIRARTLMLIENRGVADATKYLNFILPLLDDPDDSVRWATIKLLDNLNLIKENFLVCNKLKDHLIQEENTIIKKKLEKIFKN